MKHTKVQMIEQTVPTELECDMCGKKKYYYAKNWEGERYSVKDGCTISTEEGDSYPEFYSTEERSADLCFECTTKVLDWIVSQGGNTHITKTDV